MSNPAPHALIGETLGGYAVEQIVGAGAFAWVFRATAPDGSPVAIKLLRASGAQARSFFARELKIMRALAKLPTSEHCVRYVADGELPDGAGYLVMEFVDGVTLKDAMRHKRVWAERDACELMVQLCSAFAGLHHLGLAHRDVKPENVMLTRDYRVKLMDFGIVKDAQGLLRLYEAEEVLSLKGSDFAERLDRGILAGTPEYMAPEQFLDAMESDESRERTDTWTDVYSLALIFYELLTGAKLYPMASTEGLSAEEFQLALGAYLRGRAAAVHEPVRRHDAIGPALWSLLERALRSDPKARPRDAREFGTSIETFLATGEGAADEEWESTALANADDVKAAVARAMALNAEPAPASEPAREGGASLRMALDIQAVQRAARDDLDDLTRPQLEPDESRQASKTSAASPAASAAASPAAPGAHASSGRWMWVVVLAVLVALGALSALLARRA